MAKYRKNKFYYNKDYPNKESIERLCVSYQEEYKARNLLHSAWPTTDQLFHADYLHRLLKVLEVIPPTSRVDGSKVLDVGCGEGRLMLILKRLGFDVTGVDKYTFSGLNTQGEPRGPLLEKYFSEQGVHADVIDIEKDTLPYSNNSFALVTFVEVIEHLHNSPRPILQEIARVCRAGGYVLVATPNHAALYNRIRAVFGKSNHPALAEFYNFRLTQPPSLEFTGHFREYTLAEIEQMLKWENFEIIHSETYHFPMISAGLPAPRKFLVESGNLIYKLLYRSGFGRALLPNTIVVARKRTP